MPCSHNIMVPNNSPTHVWKCADCGYVYGVDEFKSFKFVILEGIIKENIFQRFFSENTDDDPTKGDTGVTWYKIIGYANSIKEAQRRLCGRSY